MQRLAFRPLLRALRVPNSSLRAARLVPSAAGRSVPFSARRYTTTTPPESPPPLQEPARVSTKASLDPAGDYTPSEYVSIQLNSPELQPIIQGLSPEDLAAYESLLKGLNTENGRTDLLALNDLGEFLAERGVDLDLPDSIFDPPTEETYYETEDSSAPHISFNEPQKKPNTPTLRSLMDPSPLDARDVLTIPSSKQNPYGGRVIIRNHTSIFDTPAARAAAASSSSSSSSTSGEGTSQSFALPMSQVRNLYQSILIARTVKQQTGKGKIMRKYFLVLVGDGNGLVGYGQAKDFNARLALQKARIEAVKSMDWVERFEQRTVWTEMETKLGATRLIVRPRPVGFGLRCNPFLHQIMRAAGFKDISAKVWGSRNKLNVIKAAFRMLHAGHAPVGMGDGVGGKGKRLSKGIGMQGQAELERARGRKLISLRK